MALSVWAALVVPAWAQSPVSPVARDGVSTPAVPETIGPTEDGRLTMRASRISEPIRLDGLLDETVYRTVPSVTGFVQTEPVPGEAAVEQTEAWVFFDDEHLFIAVRAKDSQANAW